MKLSEHFTTEEFQCHCCGKLTVDPRLIEILELLRQELNRPIIITSGYRCKRNNEMVGGVPGSYHTKGKAADFKVNGMKPAEVVEFIEKNLPDIANSCGLGLYSTWVHIDSRGYRARWCK